MGAKLFWLATVETESAINKRAYFGETNARNWVKGRRALGRQNPLYAVKTWSVELIAVDD